jgi:Flp pilus assembly protein TadD
MGLGITALLDNDLGAAHDHLEATVKAMPGHLGSWNMLGWIHLLNNDLESARTAFEKANSIDRNFAETHGGLAIVAALGGDWDKATTLTDTALRLAPDSLAGRYAQSLIVAHRGRPEQAAKMVETLLEKTAAPGGGSLKEMLQRFSIRAGAGKGATTGSGSTSALDPGMAPEPDAGSA